MAGESDRPDGRFHRARRDAARPGRLAVEVAAAGASAGPARGLSRWLVAAAPPRAAGSVSIAVVSDARMRALNRRYRGKDRVTDVLSFSFPGRPAPGLRHLVPGLWAKSSSPRAARGVRPPRPGTRSPPSCGCSRCTGCCTCSATTTSATTARWRASSGRCAGGSASGRGSSSARARRRAAGSDGDDPARALPARLRGGLRRDGAGRVQRADAPVAPPAGRAQRPAPEARALSRRSPAALRARAAPARARVLDLGGALRRAGRHGVGPPRRAAAGRRRGVHPAGGARPAAPPGPARTGARARAAAAVVRGPGRLPAADRARARAPARLAAGRAGGGGRGGRAGRPRPRRPRTGSPSRARSAACSGRSWSSAARWCARS